MCESFYTEGFLGVHMQFVHETYQFPCNKCTYKGKSQGYLENCIIWILDGKRPNVSCVMTRLLRKHAGQGMMNFYLALTGQSTKQKEPLINRCIECGKTNATLVEVDKHMIIPNREKHIVCK